MCMQAYTIRSISTVTCCFFFNDTATTEIYTLSLHDALPIFPVRRDEVLTGFGGEQRVAQLGRELGRLGTARGDRDPRQRSEEHTSELQSRQYLVCRLLLEKKKKYSTTTSTYDNSAKHVFTHT